MRRLLSLVSDLYLAELALPEVEVSVPDPMITVEDLFGALHELMLNHPVVAPTMSRQPLDGPVGWRFAEHALAVLTGYGIDPVAAGR